jgi:hypothetical protein
MARDPASNALLDLRFLLRCKLVENLSEVTAKLQIQRLAPAFWNKHNVIFALPSRVT